MRGRGSPRVCTPVMSTISDHSDIAFLRQNVLLRQLLVFPGWIALLDPFKNSHLAVGSGVPVVERGHIMSAVERLGSSNQRSNYFIVQILLTQRGSNQVEQSLSPCKIPG